MIDGLISNIKLALRTSFPFLQEVIGVGRMNTEGMIVVGQEEFGGVDDRRGQYAYLRFIGDTDYLVERSDKKLTGQPASRATSLLRLVVVHEGGDVDAFSQSVVAVLGHLYACNPMVSIQVRSIDNDRNRVLLRETKNEAEQWNPVVQLTQIDFALVWHFTNNCPPSQLCNIIEPSPPVDCPTLCELISEADWAAIKACMDEGQIEAATEDLCEPCPPCPDLCELIGEATGAEVVDCLSPEQFTEVQELVCEPCPPCEDATVELNGVEVATVASGATVNLPILQDGSPVGSWNGTEWEIPPCPTPTFVTTVFEITTDGTYTKPAGFCEAEIICISGGGGGGSGMRGPTSTNRCGGGGGASGSVARLVVTDADIVGPINYTIGAGGVGGAAVAVDDTNGANGGAGGDTSFGSLVIAKGGGGGVGGTAATSANGGTANALGSNTPPSAYNSLYGVTGGRGVTTSAGLAAQQDGFGTGALGSNGGGGGGISNTNVLRSGGTGSRGYNASNILSGVVAGGNTTSAPNGGNGGSNWSTQLSAHPSTLTLGMGQGGGGGGATSGAGGNGGNGGDHGAGGGGGGASTNGNLSGAGGNGGNGCLIIIEKKYST